MKQYRLNECFFSLQGEGVRAGTANVFVRFSGCNLACSKEVGERSPGNFDCDTEFVSGRSLTLEDLFQWVRKCSADCRWLILTGGEPGLQVDAEFCDYFHDRGYRLAIETNGSIELPHKVQRNAPDVDESKQYLFDWITVSPKVAEHCIRQKWAHELRYVRGYGQGIPKPQAKADYYLISPAFDGGIVLPETLEWCMKLVLENPQWRLSCQQHKFWNVR